MIPSDEKAPPRASRSNDVDFGWRPWSLRGSSSSRFVHFVAILVTVQRRRALAVYAVFFLTTCLAAPTMAGVRDSDGALSALQRVGRRAVVLEMPHGEGYENPCGPRCRRLSNEPSGITELIQRASLDPTARDDLFRHIYQELRQCAQRALGFGKRGELQTTELVNEVYLRIEKADCLKSLSNRRMFFAVAGKAMRHVLIDHYRKGQRRLEGKSARQPLDFLIEEVEQQTDADFESLARELDRLERESPRQHAVIMHRYFAGLSVAETAEMLDVSADTVKRDWMLARVKLLARLKPHDDT